MKALLRILMLMLTIVCSLLLVVAVYVYAEVSIVPEAPTFTGIAGMSKQGTLVTNVTWVYTNVAVVAPFVKFPQVTIYNGTNGLSECSVLSWAKSTNQSVTRYVLYYGNVLQDITNKIEVMSCISCVVFFNIFDSNLTYWSYVTAGDATHESPPSKIILFQGK